MSETTKAKYPKVAVVSSDHDLTVKNSQLLEFRDTSDIRDSLEVRISGNLRNKSVYLDEQLGEWMLVKDDIDQLVLICVKREK